MAPVRKLRNKLGIEKLSRHSSHYFKTIDSGKKIPKSQCSVVVFKPHETRLASLLTHYLNHIGKQTGKSIDLSNAARKKKTTAKKVVKKKTRVVKATTIQKGNTEVVPWTDRNMKQFLSPQMSNAIMLWRPRTPERKPMHVRIPDKLKFSTSNMRMRKRLPRSTSAPSLSYAAWRPVRATSSVKSCPSRQTAKLRKRSSWDFDLPKYSHTSIRSQSSRKSMRVKRKKVKTQAISALSLFNSLIDEQARTYIDDFLKKCAAIKAGLKDDEGQDIDNIIQDTVDMDSYEPMDDDRDPIQERRDQRLPEKQIRRLNIMDPVQEVEEELYDDDQGSPSSIDLANKTLNSEQSLHSIANNDRQLSPPRRSYDSNAGSRHSKAIDSLSDAIENKLSFSESKKVKESNEKQYANASPRDIRESRVSYTSGKYLNTGSDEALEERGNKTNITSKKTNVTNKINLSQESPLEKGSEEGVSRKASLEKERRKQQQLDKAIQKRKMIPSHDELFITDISIPERGSNLPKERKETDASKEKVNDEYLTPQRMPISKSEGHRGPKTENERTMRRKQRGVTDSPSTIAKSSSFSFQATGRKEILQPEGKNTSIGDKSYASNKGKKNPEIQSSGSTELVTVELNRTSVLHKKCLFSVDGVSYRVCTPAEDKRNVLNMDTNDVESNTSLRTQCVNSFRKQIVKYVNEVNEKSGVHLEKNGQPMDIKLQEIQGRKRVRKKL